MSDLFGPIPASVKVTGTWLRCPACGVAWFGWGGQDVWFHWTNHEAATATPPSDEIVARVNRAIDELGHAMGHEPGDGPDETPG